MIISRGFELLVLSGLQGRKNDRVFALRGEQFGFVELKPGRDLQECSEAIADARKLRRKGISL